MRILDLGPLWIESAGVTRPLGGRRLEAVLCALLVRPGEVVSTDSLIDAVWGDEAPRRSAAALDTLTWRLRRRLEPDRTAGAPSAILRTEEQGYRLTLPVEDVDSWSFAHIAERLSDDDLSVIERLDRTAAALGMWRGRPYDTVPETGLLLAAQARLEEQRLMVQRFRIDALLDAGQPERAVADVIPMLAQEPYAEPLWARRIVGLRHAGRPAAASAAYRECVQLFRRELGAAPGPEVRAAVKGVDTHVRGEPATVRPPPRSGEFRVPRRRSRLVGRRDELGAVGELLRRRRQACLVGPVGCGKTRLAIAVAGTLRDDHPDGVFFVDLVGVVQGSLVADRVQEILKLSNDRLSGAEAVVCDFLSTRTVLLVLDNCEQVTDAVAAFAETVLATCPSVSILVTSRQPLGIDGEAVFLLHPLAVPTGSGIPELAASSAAVLLAERLDDRTGFADFSDGERDAIAQICTATDGLPLSLELATALSPVLTLHEIAVHLTTNPTGLRSYGRPLRESRGEATLRDSIERSHRLLPRIERIAHRRLAVLPPEFTLDAAVAVCADHQLPADMVPAALAGLTYRSLLDAIGSERAGGPSLFRQLVPMRSHAAEQLRKLDEMNAVTERRDAWARNLVMSGPRHGRVGQSAHYQLLEDNHRSVAAALEAAIAAGPSDEDVFAIGRLLPYWIDRMIAPDPMRITAALAAAVTRSNSPLARLVAVMLRGAVLAVNQQATVGHDAMAEAVAELQRLGVDDTDRERGLQTADLLITVAACCWVGDDYDLATVISRTAGAHAEALDDPDVRLCAAMFECLMLLWQDPERAAVRAEMLFVESMRIGNDFAALIAGVTCSIAAVFAGDGPAGLRSTAESLALQHRLGVRNISDTLETRGNHYVASGQPVEAVRCYAAAHLHQTRLGRDWPHHPGTAERLATARESLSSLDFDGAWAAGERLGAEELIDGWL